MLSLFLFVYVSLCTDGYCAKHIDLSSKFSRAGESRLLRGIYMYRAKHKGCCLVLAIQETGCEFICGAPTTLVVKG